MLNEELLEVLVCVVNAELLEAVRLEVLEAEDVEDSDGITLYQSIASVKKLIKKYCFPIPPLQIIQVVKKFNI